MTTATSSLEKFQTLLRELFQFDQADLDFGIYRIMNHKRDAVERFITEQLPSFVADELDQGPLAKQAQAAAHLMEVERRVREALGKAAIDSHGILASQHHELPIGREYLEAQAQATSDDRSRDAVEAAIYNHLWTFLSRYYADGDFISQRRYSSNQRYAIPYNGEEVYLHWANSDQYYVKTDEHFRNYDYQAPNGVKVQFRLLSVDVEENNVTGARRFFIPCLSETTFDDIADAVTIFFEYRPLSTHELITYGNRNQQHKILTKTAPELIEHLRDNTRAMAALTGERRSTEHEEPISYLQHHLRRYVKRNNSDFFIHKDLAGFLNRELDFYLKNEVLHLDNLTAAGQNLAEGWFQQARLTKQVGSRIIDFLAQLEDFQKMLWEKRKFITETHYCVLLGSIDPQFYPSIAGNDDQWDEWRELYGLDGNNRTRNFLDAHPTLTLDTKHFSTDFNDRLLASFESLDHMTSGLLIHGDNWQALNLAKERYNGRVACVHIDPPYNTQTSGFLYKNDYQHSSWLTMMADRIAAAIPLLHNQAAFLAHIDENEYELLHLLFSKIGIPDAGTIVWDKKNPMLGRRSIATQHEYVLWRTWNASPVHMRPRIAQQILNKAEFIVKKHGRTDNAARREFKSWLDGRQDLTGGERAYNLLDDNGRVFQSVGMGAPEPRTHSKYHVPLIHPITGQECPVPANGWSRAPETLRALMEKDEVLFGQDESAQPRKKVYLADDKGRQLSSVVSDGGRGKTDLDRLGLEFPYCHPVSLYEDLLGAAAKPLDMLLDHFAGSGTTGHAVINLNRDDAGERRFMLVEAGGEFDSVLLPRIKRVIYSPEWKKGKPLRKATKIEAERSPKVIKYLRLESYEDALDSIVFDDDPIGQLRLAEQGDEYLLKQMVGWETKDNDTLLNASKLTLPFSYRLRVHVKGVKQERPIDLPETFNLLLGLVVQKREIVDDGGRRYLVYRGEEGGTPGKKVNVIWRETEGWTEDDFTQDRDFLLEHDLTSEADVVYVNGDSAIPDATPIEPMFKARMFATVGT